MFGCSSSTIKDRCKKYGIKLRPSQKGKLKGLNEETLRRLYVKEQMSMSKIARMLGCSLTSIRYRLKKYGIKIKKMKDIKGLNKPTLHRLYVKEGKSINKIAEKFACSYGAIEFRCRRYGIQLRSPRRIKGLTKSELQKLYVKEGKTVREIAGIVGCSRDGVRYRCQQFGIPLRKPGSKKLEIDKSTLRRLYIKEGKSGIEVADIFDCSISVISQRVKLFGLKKRDGGRQ
jgi:DNA-binding CsgD family transcriptional regulator